MIGYSDVGFRTLTYPDATLVVDLFNEPSNWKSEPLTLTESRRLSQLNTTILKRTLYPKRPPVPITSTTIPVCCSVVHVSRAPVHSSPLGHPHFAEAEALTDLIKARSKVDVVLVRAQELCAEAATRMSENDATTILRTVSVQVILHVGSRSFSHFLNAIERYLSLLKFFSKDTEAKAQILDTAAKFWRRNSQMIAIVFDKFMQYQVVDPADVVAWSFRSSATNGDHRVEGSIGIKGWQILKAALDKASGRVVIAKRKVQKVKKEEEDAKAKLKASKVVDDVMEEEIAMQDGTVFQPRA